MELVILCVMLIAVCAVGVACIGHKHEEDISDRTDSETAQQQREREREAHYMRNFWSYDGSEQQDWDEEV